MRNRSSLLAACLVATSMPLVAQDEAWVSDGLSLARFDLESLQRTNFIQIANGLRDVAVSADQQEVWVGYPDGLAIVSPGAGAQVGNIVLDDPRGLIFAADTLVYAGNVDSEKGGQIVIIDADLRSVIDSIPIGGDPTSAVLSPDGSRLYATDRETDSVFVIDTATREVITSVATGSDPLHCVVSADGTRLYASTAIDVTVIDTAGPSALTTYALGDGGLARLAISPDGQRLYAADVGGLHVVEAATGDSIATLPIAFLSDIVLTEDGSMAVVSQEVLARVVLIDTVSLQVIEDVQHPTPGLIDLRGTAIFADGFESGDTSAWSTGGG